VVEFSVLKVGGVTAEIVGLCNSGLADFPVERAAGGIVGTDAFLSLVRGGTDRLCEFDADVDDEFDSELSEASEADDLDWREAFEVVQAESRGEEVVYAAGFGDGNGGNDENISVSTIERCIFPCGSHVGDDRFLSSSIWLSTTADLPSGTGFGNRNESNMLNLMFNSFSGRAVYIPSF